MAPAGGRRKFGLVTRNAVPNAVFGGNREAEPAPGHTCCGRGGGCYDSPWAVGDVDWESRCTQVKVGGVCVQCVLLPWLLLILIVVKVLDVSGVFVESGIAAAMPYGMKGDESGNGTASGNAPGAAPAPTGNDGTSGGSSGAHVQDGWDEGLYDGLDEWQTQFVRLHNERRFLHCNTPPLSHSPAAEASTKVAAGKCRFEHGLSGSQPGGPFGENLWGTSGTYTIAGAVSAWYNEIGKYSWASPGYSSAVGHFTQVVWRVSTSVGCSWCDNGSMQIIICQYSPPGNLIGAFAENVAPLKSAGPCPPDPSASQATRGLRGETMGAANDSRVEAERANSHRISGLNATSSFALGSQRALEDDAQEDAGLSEAEIAVLVTLCVLAFLALVWALLYLCGPESWEIKSCTNAVCEGCYGGLRCCHWSCRSGCFCCLTHFLSPWGLWTVQKEISKSVYALLSAAARGDDASELEELRILDKRFPSP